MDGVYFLQNSVEIFVHQELVVQKQLPELLDLSATARVDHLELVNSAVLCLKIAFCLCSLIKQFLFCF